MQLAGDTALAAAVDAEVRYLACRFEVDWNRDGLYAHALSDLTDVVADIQFERSLTGSLPQETTVVEGWAATDLTAVLEGQLQGTSIATLLSPWNRQGPLYGQGRPLVPCRWTLGVRKADGSTPMMPQFAGYLVALQVSASGSVKITARDGAERLRASITLPLDGLDDMWAELSPSTDYRTNSHAVIDYVLRRNGIYQSPPPQPGCILSVPGHGGLFPEIGFSTGNALIGRGVCTESDPIAVPGLYGLAYNGSPRFCVSWFGQMFGTFDATPGAKWSAQFLARYGTDDVINPEHDGTVLSLGTYSGFGIGTVVKVGLYTAATGTPGRVWVKFFNDTTLVSAVTGPAAVAATAAWHNVAVGFTLGSPLSASSVTITVDGVSATTAVNLSGLSPAPLTDPNPTALWFIPVPIQCIQVCRVTTTYAAHQYGAWTSQADVDAGLNEIGALPAVRGVDSWELLKQVAGAEYGTVGFDETGRFFFRNRNTVRRQSIAVDKALSGERGLKALTLTERSDSIRNAITVTTARRWLKVATAVYETQRPDDIIVPPGYNTFALTLREPVQLQQGQVYAYADTATWEASGTGGGVTLGLLANNAYSNSDATGVTAYVYPNPDNTTFLLAVNNSNAFSVRFATTNGAPALKLVGYRFADDPPVTQVYKRQTSIDRYDERVLDVPATPWRQRQQFMAPIARALLKDLKAPVAVVDQVPVVGDPRLQLTDTVELPESTGLGGPIPAVVTGITRRLSRTEGLSDTLTVRPFAPAGAWILGDTRYSILGQTTRLG